MEDDMTANGMTINEMRTKVDEKVKECLRLYIERFDQDEIAYPEITFDLTGSAAGMCLFRASTKTAKIRFNEYMMKHSFEEFIENIVPHEMAHYCADHLYGIQTTKSGRIQHHGIHWQHMMRVFGVEPERCHNLKYKTGRNLRRFEYTCECGEKHMITSIIHNRIKRGKSYVCSRCNTRLSYVRECKQ
jgi:SprT protein